MPPDLLMPAFVLVLVANAVLIVLAMRSLMPARDGADTKPGPAPRAERSESTKAPTTRREQATTAPSATPAFVAAPDPEPAPEAVRGVGPDDDRDAARQRARRRSGPGRTPPGGAAPQGPQAGHEDRHPGRGGRGDDPAATRPKSPPAAGATARPVSLPPVPPVPPRSRAAVVGSPCRRSTTTTRRSTARSRASSPAASRRPTRMPRRPPSPSWRSPRRPRTV